MKSAIHIVFTGPAATRDGRPIVRRDLIAHVTKHGFVVANRVGKETQLLVASRADTVKAASARDKGIPVMTYGAFLDQFGGNIPLSGITPNSYTDLPLQPVDDSGVDYL